MKYNIIAMKSSCATHIEENVTHEIFWLIFHVSLLYVLCSFQILPKVVIASKCVRATTLVSFSDI